MTTAAVGDRRKKVLVLSPNECPQDKVLGRRDTKSISCTTTPYIAKL